MISRRFISRIEFSTMIYQIISYVTFVIEVSSLKHYSLQISIWDSLFRPEKYLGSLKAPTLSSIDTLCRANPSYFHGNNTLYVKEALFIKWASKITSKNQFRPVPTPCFYSDSTYLRAKTSFLSGTRAFCTDRNLSNLQSSCRIPRAMVEAQGALLDYLYYTRGLQFSDAEHMSKNSPLFLRKLLNRVEKEEHIERALRRFFNFHPINEFELFFESLGLKPGEFDSFLPRELMFLSDDERLLENYHVLCNFGIARGKIGKIYKEATEIFRYKLGVLGSKLHDYEGLGLSKSSTIKIVASNPSFLVGDVNKEFVKVLEELEGVGIERDWIAGVLSEKSLYDWGKISMVLKLFIEMGFTEQELGTLIRRHPGFLLDGSGNTMLSMIVLFLKLGKTRLDIKCLFSQFPGVQVGIFKRNLLRGLLFLAEIEMDPEDIQKLMRTHTEVFGSCSLKKPNSIFANMNVGKKRLCNIIKDDPHQLKKYVFGVKLNPLPNPGWDERSLLEKKKFLLSLGFVEGSKEMKKALTVFRGKGDELQDRYDFLVKTGLDPNDVLHMVKRAPHILNHKIDFLESKIDFLVNNLGYPLSSLVAFPAFVVYTAERIKLRLLMYNWLKDRGKASPTSKLSSIIVCSEKLFWKRFIRHHPEGPEAFRVHGEIEEGAVIFDKATEKSCGYGLITYCHMESTKKALREPSKLIM